ncbi:UPF0223 family protein [Staphylococcus gallinarum]|uniref:UPF0223 protein BUZ14_03170 n=1 Tax=Staphylococcus gallinarum TaxID=1293 RepID=A0A3A0VSA6_STAGA|nr:UPF0223 family protein [Staphylococcus gallinarum]RIP35663.1 UPF0223 family protein [Staphylococcus gallinarum]
MEYQYPIDLDWSNEEMMDVVAFFNSIEAFYEAKVEGQQLLNNYKKFKNVVPGKAEEKQIFKEFEKNSGYNSYQVVKTVQNTPEQKYFSSNDK